MLPISESMKRPEKFNIVLSWSIFVVFLVFTSVGTLGYLAFGKDVETIVFLNLPMSAQVTTIQFLYALAICLSFPLTMYPAVRISEKGIQLLISDIWFFYWQEVKSY